MMMVQECFNEKIRNEKGFLTEITESSLKGLVFLTVPVHRNMFVIILNKYECHPPPKRTKKMELKSKNNFPSTA